MFNFHTSTASLHGLADYAPALCRATCTTGLHHNDGFAPTAVHTPVVQNDMKAFAHLYSTHSTDGLHCSLVDIYGAHVYSYHC